jgi:hypothetical protein
MQLLSRVPIRMQGSRKSMELEVHQIMVIVQSLASIILLNNMGPHYMKMGWWGFNLNLSLPEQVFKHPAVICLGHTK